MRDFARLYTTLDETTATGEKVAALAEYFRTAPPADAAWAVHFLIGRRPKRLVSAPKLAAWASEAAGIPAWLFEESYAAVGDLAETITLLLPDTGASDDRGLSYWVEQRLLPLRAQDEAVQREIFGPVLTVQSFRDDAQALAMANGVDYALAASVWTSDHTRAMRFAKHLDFGCVWINTHIPFVSDMPHGGFKHSGYGKDLSNYGFEDYTRIKHVMSRIG